MELDLTGGTDQCPIRTPQQPSDFNHSAPTAVQFNMVHLPLSASRLCISLVTRQINADC
jgi:hypothetical protein